MRLAVWGVAELLASKKGEENNKCHMRTSTTSLSATQSVAVLILMPHPTVYEFIQELHFKYSYLN